MLRAGCAPGMSAASVVPGGPGREQRGGKESGRAGFQPESFCCEPTGGSGEGQGWWQLLCPTFSWNPAPLLSISTRITIPLLSRPSAGTDTKPRAGVNSLAPTAGVNTPRSLEGPRPGHEPRAGLGLDGTGGGWRDGGAGREARAWFRPQLSLLTLRAKRRTAGSSQAARYQTSTKEANGSSP